jgi:hypothetical protein
MTRRATRRAAAAVTTALVLGLVGAASASADTSSSSNWAGYAIHRSGVRFRTVVGSWTQPRAACTAGRAAYSAMWVGLGGYSVSSPALEQIGTELDCTASGHAVSNAWYELVPAASHTTQLIVRPGDRMRAAVSVTGNEVKLTLADLTRHRSFTKTMHDTVLDTTSAEWIVEAPSLCSSAADCQTLPLADFGSAAIAGARVTTTAGYRGSIADRHWATTEISLAAGARIFAGTAGERPILAAPSPLSANGTGFTVSYGGTTTTAETARASAASSAARRLVHPRR